MASARLVIEGWPALMSLEMASRYLSLDDTSFSEIALQWGLDPIDVDLETLRWRKSDIDKLVKRLPTAAIREGRQQPRQISLDEATIHKMAAAVAMRLEGRAKDKQRSLVSIKDATELLGVGRSTIYRLINSEQLSTRQIGRRTLIPMADIEAILSPD